MEAETPLRSHRMSEVSREVLLILEDGQMKAQWISAITAHTQYIESVISQKVMNNPTCAAMKKAQQDMLQMEEKLLEQDDVKEERTFFKRSRGRGGSSQPPVPLPLYKEHLMSNEKIFAVGMVGKVNPLGVVTKRLLVLTDHPRCAL